MEAIKKNQMEGLELNNVKPKWKTQWMSSTVE